MKLNKFYSLLITTIGLVILVSCGGNQKLINANMAHLYQQHGVVLKPMFTVYHTDQSHSELYIQAASNQLLYIKDLDQPNLYKANIKASYYLYNSFESTEIIDSGSVYFEDQKAMEQSKIIEHKIQFNSAANIGQEQMVLKVVLTDLNRKLDYQNTINIYRNDQQNRQNFLLKSKNNKVRFFNVVAKNEGFILENNAGISTYKVRYYNREFPVALPPYANNASVQFKYAADSTFSISSNDTIYLPKNGFYHFQLNEKTKEGYSVFCFEHNFPFVTKKLEMGEPLRYLTNGKEYEDLKKINNSDSLKYLVDQFWLRSAGSIERGKYLVSEYYNRIEQANLYFSSYLEGWKTDRGIVYVILGPPSRVLRTFTNEIWVYGNENSSMDMTFNFAKVYNPFTDNDYALSRMNKYRYPWGQAIDAWRHGTAYGEKEIIRAQDERDQQLRATAPPNFWY